MGLKLRILTWWTPNWIIRRELDHVSNITTAALTTLIAVHKCNGEIETSETKLRQPRTIEEKRSKMAAEHAALVQELATIVGRDEAISQGRKALYQVGQRLGKETRGKLGGSISANDMIKAAKILYRILGIEFTVEWSGETHATLVVDRCALAQHYSELTCQVLSATDEGAVKGLDPQATMKFKELITSGCPKCRAEIEFTKPRNKT